MGDSKAAVIVLFIIAIMMAFFFSSDKISLCRQDCYCKSKSKCTDSCINFLSFFKIEDCNTPLMKTIFQEDKSKNNKLPESKSKNANDSQINELLNN